MDLTGRGAANTSRNKGIWPSADPGNAKATGYDSEGATLGFTKIPYKTRPNVERQPPDLGLFTGRRRTNSRNPPAARSRGSRLTSSRAHGSVAVFLHGASGSASVSSIS